MRTSPSTKTGKWAPVMHNLDNVLKYNSLIHLPVTLKLCISSKIVMVNKTHRFLLLILRYMLSESRVKSYCTSMKKPVFYIYKLVCMTHFFKYTINGHCLNFNKSNLFYFTCRRKTRPLKMAYIASSEYSRVTSDTTERRGPQFGMEKGTRVHPGQIYFQGKYINEAEFFKVRSIVHNDN